MIKIRAAQMTAFERTALAGYEERTLQHFKRYFPRKIQVAGEEIARKVIRFGVEQARDYGFTSERNVTLYISMMWVLGGLFDEDRQLPWAGSILTDPDMPSSRARIGRLHAAALRYVERTAGVEGENLNRAMVRLHDGAHSMYGQTFQGDFTEHMLQLFEAIYPEKYCEVGEATLRGVVDEGSAASRRYGLIGERGERVYLVLMFMLGSHFDRDPQLPWARAILTASTVERREARLMNEAMSYLERWL